MEIDISEKQLRKGVDAIRLLDSLDFEEITDGNKMDKIWLVTNTLNDLAMSIEEAIDDTEDDYDGPYMEGMYES